MSEKINRPITGLRGVEHVGITVPDVDTATLFFETVLGAERLFEIGPFMAEDN